MQFKSRSVLGVYAYFIPPEFPSPSSVSNGTRHAGPPLGIVATVFVVLFLAGLYPVTMFGGQPYFPGPWESPDTIVTFFQTRSTGVLATAFLHFGAAIPLGIFTATAVSRLQFLGVRAAGAFIALRRIRHRLHHDRVFVDVVDIDAAWNRTRQGPGASALLVGSKSGWIWIFGAVRPANRWDMYFCRTREIAAKVDRDSGPLDRDLWRVELD